MLKRWSTTADGSIIRHGKAGFIGRSIVVAVALVIAAPLPARSASPPPCPTPTETARVAAIVDDLDVALEDGRTLRLAGIDPARDTAADPHLSETARRSLESRLVGQDVPIRLLASAPDRWDRVAALAGLPQASNASPSGSSTSLNEVLIAEGWARAKPEQIIRGCGDAFQVAEQQARSDRLGLWADPFYAIVAADDLPGLAARVGSMVLVEGRLALHESRGRLYLRLGRGFRSVAGVVARARVAKLLREGIDLHAMAGASLRLRGYLDARFGPKIEITEAGQIEVLRRDEPTASDDAPFREDAATKNTGLVKAAD